MVDLSDRRILAAMKLMGIDEEDLEVAGSGALTERSHRDQRRQDVLERRRNNLLKEIQQKADYLQEDAVDAILLSEASEQSRSSSTFYDSLRTRIDSSRERTKASFERKVANELKRREMREVCASKWEWELQRVRDFRKEAENEASQRTDVRQKKFLENAAAAAKVEMENRRKVQRKLQEDAQRTQRHLDDRSKRVEEAREERMRKMMSAAERSAKHNLEEQEIKLQRQEQVREREKELEAWKERQREEAFKASEERSAKLMEKMQRVEDTMNRKLADREKACFETLEKLTRARQVATQAKVDIAEKVKQQREKEEKKWAENRKRVVQERREKLLGWRTHFEEKDEKSQTAREHYFSTTFGKQAASRALFREIVDKNKARLQRSEDCSRELTLAKIQSERAKQNAEKEQKSKAVQYRAEALREALLTKALVDEISVAASPRRVQHVLQELGMESLSSGAKVKEGEETTERVT